MQQRWVIVLLMLALAGLSWAIVVWPGPEPELSAEAAPGATPIANPEPPPSVAVTPEPSAPEAPSEPAPLNAQPAAAPSAPVAAEIPTDDPPLFDREMGPVAEYKERFASEPRDSAANDAEQQVRDAFKLTDSASPVFRTVLCRKTVCKIEVRLTPDQLGAYVAGMGRLTQNFDKKLAYTRTAEHAGQVSLEVYAQRLPQAE
jgi:hypothetical protein